MAVETVGDESGCAGSAEGIKHGSSDRAAGLDARFDEGRRKGCEVRFGVWPRGNRPNVAEAAPGRTLIAAKYTRGRTIIVSDAGLPQ